MAVIQNISNNENNDGGNEVYVNWMNWILNYLKCKTNLVKPYLEIASQSCSKTIIISLPMKLILTNVIWFVTLES